MNKKVIKSKVAEDYGIDARTILVEIGNQRIVGGLKDMIVDVALYLVKQKKRINHLLKGFVSLHLF